MIVLWPWRDQRADRRTREASRIFRRPIVLGILGVLGALGSLAACAPTADDSKLPPDVTDPKSLRTPAGALELYQSALGQLSWALDRTMVTGAILTDELAALPAPLTIEGPYTSLDSRLDPEPAGVEPYNRLHRLRAQVREARGFLGAYSTDTAMARARQGHLYAAEGYADVLLADLFCSGIPLSTVDFQGDYTLKPGSSTREVYLTALGLFDSALVLLQDPVPEGAVAPDSLRLFQQLAAVGKGRTLLALGDYASAAQAVAAVPTEFRYQMVVLSPVMAGFTHNDPGVPSGYAYVVGIPGVGSNEGKNGLDYVDAADTDPRVGGLALPGGGVYGGTYYFPAKYAPDGPIELTLADGIEARLIEAEAALQAGRGEWLTILNALRTDGAFEVNPDDPADTLWHPGLGTGLPVGLKPLEDPGTAEAREDILFQERAFWLYLTAHREGDLRRLLRPPYGRAPDAVYPTEDYQGGTGRYGSQVMVPVPQAERTLNPQYTGCISGV